MKRVLIYYIEIWVLDNNTWNHLTVWKQLLA